MTTQLLVPSRLSPALSPSSRCHMRSRTYPHPDKQNRLLHCPLATGCPSVVFALCVCVCVVQLLTTTVLLVGYGDYVPGTHGGRIIAIFAGLSGLFLIAALIAILSFFLRLSRAETKVGVAVHCVVPWLGIFLARYPQILVEPCFCPGRVAVCVYPSPALPSLGVSVSSRSGGHVPEETRA